MQSEKRFLQTLADCAVRLVKNEHLALVEKIFVKTMKQMQEVAEESDAIQNRDFDTASFVILGAAMTRKNKESPLLPQAQGSML